MSADAYIISSNVESDESDIAWLENLHVKGLSLI